MNLRGDSSKLIPLLPHINALKKVIPYSTVLNGSFKPFLDAHVTDPWLLSWLNALAFSLSGLPADQTGAAAMAYTLYDLHRSDGCLDYPRGGCIHMLHLRVAYVCIFGICVRYHIMFVLGLYHIVFYFAPCLQAELGG